MATTSTPQWVARHNGAFGDMSAIQNAGDLNQLLGTHGVQVVYQGAPLTTNVYNLVTTRTPNTPWQAPMTQYDIDQPFVLGTGTTVGRVSIGLLAVGNGADLLVSLCSDNGGAPGTVITQTRVPAAWIYQLSPVSGTASSQVGVPYTSLTNNPLATSLFSAFYRNVATTISPFPVPAYTGIAAASSTSWYAPYMIQVGGVNNDVALTNVFTTPYNSLGAYSPQIQQAPFPAANDGSSMTCVVLDSVTGGPVAINTGGGTAYEGPAVSTAYTASLSTTTGTLSAWTQQSAMLYSVQNHAFCASPAGYIYVLGGRNPSGLLNTVSYAQVQNGQVGTWNYTTPLPTAIQLSAACVVNDFLFLCGGSNALFVAETPVWYAPINSDGSLGNWIQGPTFPTGFDVFNANPFGNDYGIVCSSGAGAVAMTLPVTASGPGLAWSKHDSFFGTYPGFTDQGNGIISVGAIAASNTPPTAGYASFYLSPQISVPLPTSGLTNGATYHILFQQVGGDLNDYLILNMVDEPAISGQSSPPNTYSWTAWPENASGGRPVGAAMVVYDNSVPTNTLTPAPLHTWEDNGARITTLINATTPDNTFLGICESTSGLAAQNANQGFETGLSPWTVTGGTYAQSTTEVFEGVYSCQITPSGSASSVYITSEILDCLPGQPIRVQGAVWFTNAVTTNFSLSVNWYTTGDVLISTTSSLISVPAATWTQISNVFTAVSAPSLAYRYSVQPTLSGTPSSGQIWYVGGAIGGPKYVGTQNASVTQLTYAESGYPLINGAQPTGLVRLA